jgi:hypothetical protein
MFSLSTVPAPFRTAHLRNRSREFGVCAVRIIDRRVCRIPDMDAAGDHGVTN